MNISRPLAGMAAILCAAGLALTGATGANAAETDTAGLPDRIVNGDFSYPGWGNLNYGDNTWWTSVADGASYVVHGSGNASWEPIDGFDQSLFGWSSTQTDCIASNEAWLPGQCRAGAVELQNAHEGGNTYAEITAAQENTAIYQDIATTPGTTLTWSLKHASLTDAHTDGMRVLIGAPGEETAQEATRTSVNGNGDALGPVGTLIETTASRPTENGDGPLLEPEWESYEGTYLVPEGQTVTRLTFENTSGIDRYSGNLLDDITLQVGWPLDYQLNGGTGTIPNKEGE